MMSDNNKFDYILTEQDFYPPTDNRTWKSNIGDVYDGDSFVVI